MCLGSRHHLGGRTGAGPSRLIFGNKALLLLGPLMLLIVVPVYPSIARVTGVSNLKYHYRARLSVDILRNESCFLGSLTRP